MKEKLAFVSFMLMAFFSLVAIAVNNIPQAYKKDQGLASKGELNVAATIPITTLEGRELAFEAYNTIIIQSQAQNVNTGANSDPDNFAVTDYTEAELAALPVNEPEVTADYNISNLTYHYYDFDLPLRKKDYYWGKWLNGKAGASEINNVPVLRPGNTISLIRDGYITLNGSRGYVRPKNGYYYGSGLCWSISAIGGMMDAANWHFIRNWGIPLFIFGPRDRAPHPSYYETYKPSNNGRGYTVIKAKSGGQDYTFTVNPEINRIRALQGFEVKIVMTWSNTYPGATNGENIGAYILTNKNLEAKSIYW